MMDNYSGGVTLHNVLFANNIFYTPECGVIVYVCYVDGLRMYNNTFWKSNWLGVAVGASTTRVEAYNNIFQCIDYTYMGGNPAGHTWDNNLVGFAGRGLPAQAHDVVANDPKFRRIPSANDNTSAHRYRQVTAADFELMADSPAINKGTTLHNVPATDFYNRTRVAPYDLGAIEFENNGSGIRWWERNGLVPAIREQIHIEPNPCTGSTRIRIGHCTPDEPVGIAVYTIGGEKVRQLAMLSAAGQVRWDGRDARNQPVANGLYQVRVISGNESAAHTVVVLTARMSRKP
jgi:hypothetical protein